MVDRGVASNSNRVAEYRVVASLVNEFQTPEKRIRELREQSRTLTRYLWRKRRSSRVMSLAELKCSISMQLHVDVPLKKCARECREFPVLYYYRSGNDRSLSPYRDVSASHSSPLNQNSHDVTETDALNDVFRRTMWMRERRNEDPSILIS